MSAIPLLNLPSFAQEIIVSNLDPAQVLGITLRSKVMHRIVSRSKYSRIPVRWLIQDFASVEIIMAEESLDYVRHGANCFWKVKDVECFKFSKVFHLKYGAHQDKLIIEHLLSIFNIDQFQVYLRTGKFEDLTIFEHVKKFTRVCLEGILLTPSQLKFLLEDIETDSLTLSKMPDMLTEYPREFVFNHRNISIHGFPNIPFSSILSMKSEYFFTTLNVTDSTIQDIVEFIKQWCLGGMEHFQMLCVEYKNITDEIVNSVLRWIDGMEDLVNEELLPPRRRILRPDGKEASFMFHDGLLVFNIPEF